MDVDALDALLPQMQCRQCGFAGCRPYAEALIEGRAPFDRCVPGGTSLITVLKRAVGTDLAPLPSSSVLDPSVTMPDRPSPQIAWIDEDQCIGCALCIAVCPVDAIVGAPQWMHTVLEADCTGCALCVAPCPVECIHIHEHPAPDRESGYSISPPKAREAFTRQRDRRKAEQHQKAERLLALYHPVQTIIVQSPPEVPQSERVALIDQLRARAKAKRHEGDKGGGT